MHRGSPVTNSSDGKVLARTRCQTTSAGAGRLKPSRFRDRQIYLKLRHAEVRARGHAAESRAKRLDAEMYGRILCAGGRKTGYAQSMAMSKLQEIEKAIELLPLADQLRLYCDIPHLIGRDREDLEWQRLAIEEFFKDDSPDDAVYDSI